MNSTSGHQQQLKKYLIIVFVWNLIQNVLHKFLQFINEQERVQHMNKQNSSVTTTNDINVIII